MKTLRVSAVLIMVGVAAAANAQDAISKFFEKYGGDQSFTHVNMSSKMFSLFTQMEAETDEDKEILNAISRIKGLRILAKENTRDARALYDEAFTMVPKTYEELMTVRDKDKDMRFLIKEQSGKISELVMIMGGNSEFMILSLFGEIDLKQISRIGRSMDIKGLDNLERMEKNDSKSHH